jgi:aminotransferase
MDYGKIINNRIADVRPSGIRKYFDLLNDMPEAVSLGVGEPDFITPMPIRQAAIDGIVAGQTKYTSNAGMPSLKANIAKYMEHCYDLKYDPSNEIIVTIGGSEALDLAIRVLLNEGDEVLVMEPGYVSHEALVKINNGKYVPLVLTGDNDFKLTAEVIEKNVTPKTKAILFAYPNNPTGAIMTEEELMAIVPTILKHNLMVISDEIYAELTYEGRHISIASLPGMRERTMVVQGFSKSFSMTGWRIGCICAPKELTEQMYKIHQFAVMSAPTVGQYAANFALENAFENNFALIKEMRDEYNRRRVFMLGKFKEMGLPCFEAKGAFYLFPCIKGLNISTDEFAMRLLTEHKVLVVPGESFGLSGAGYLRCCYATSMKNLEKAMKEIRNFVEKIRKEQQI